VGQRSSMGGPFRRSFQSTPIFVGTPAGEPAGGAAGGGSDTTVPKPLQGEARRSLGGC
jgi:hypothetical protein